MDPARLKDVLVRYLALILAVVLSASGVVDAQKKKDKGSVKTKAKAVLWEPVDISRQDTYYGPGGRKGIPDVSRVTLIKEEKGGYSKKYRIRDADGRTWVAKIGKESQSETAAVRLVSALGYKTEIVYLVPKLTIPGKGTFSNVRLEARPDNVDREGEWRWDKNPFKDTRQLKGLLLMMAFINNWDIKNANNVILEKGNVHHYAISDLGVSFGKTGSNSLPLFWVIGRNRNEPKDYAKSKFVKKVEDDEVKIHFNGKNRGLMKDFTIADVAWLADQLNELSDDQIRDAFRAANYSRADIDLLTRSVKDRIAQLNRAAIGGRVAGQ